MDCLSRHPQRYPFIRKAKCRLQVEHQRKCTLDRQRHNPHLHISLTRDHQCLLTVTVNWHCNNINSCLLNLHFHMWEVTATMRIVLIVITLILVYMAIQAQLYLLRSCSSNSSNNSNYNKVQKDYRFLTSLSITIKKKRSNQLRCVRHVISVIFLNPAVIIIIIHRCLVLLRNYTNNNNSSNYCTKTKACWAHRQVEGCLPHLQWHLLH